MIRILVYCALAVSLFCGPRVDGGEFEVEGTVRQIVGNSTNRFLFRVTSWGERYQVWTRDYFESPTERVVGFDDRDFFHLDRLSDSSGKTVEFGHVHSGTVATHLFGVGDLLRLAFLERPRRPDGTHLTNVTLFALNEMLIGRHRGVVGTDSPNSATGYSEVRFLGSRSQGLADEFIGDFRTTDWTQHEGIVLPLRFALRSMMPMSLNPEVPPKTMEVLEGEVIRVGAPSISDALPRPMTPSVQIRDVRFLTETGGAILYWMTNQTWVARGDPWLVAQVRDMQSRHDASPGQLKSGGIPRYFYGFAILACSLVFFLFRSLNRSGIGGRVDPEL